MHQPPLKYDRKKYNTIHPRMLKKATSKAAASEEARRTIRYVELLSDARTPLADFFSILLGRHLPGRRQRIVADQAVMFGAIVGLDAQIMLIHRFRAS